MAIAAECVFCHAQLEFPDSDLGQSRLCPRCESYMTVVRAPRRQTTTTTQQSAACYTAAGNGPSSGPVEAVAGSSAASPDCPGTFPRSAAARMTGGDSGSTLAGAGVSYSRASFIPEGLAILLGGLALAIAVFSSASWVVATLACLALAIGISRLWSHDGGRGKIAWRCGAMLAALLALLVGFWPDPHAVLIGRVSYQGRPVCSGSICVLGSDGIPNAALIQDDGSYTVPRIPVGPATIAVHSPNPKSVRLATNKFGVQKPPPPNPNWFPIPDRYADFDRSQLHIPIQRGSNRLNLDLD